MKRLTRELDVPSPDSSGKVVLMRHVFDLAFIAFGAFYSPFFIKRLLGAKDRKKLLLDRLGLFSEEWLRRHTGKRLIWVHAVSVGEVMAARLFVERLEKEFPDHEVMVSTVTPTGQEVAKQILKNPDHVFYFPFDLSRITDRVLTQLRPAVLILVETEIWPNVIFSAHRLGIPVAIVNGRISPRAFRRYRWIRFWLKRVFDKVSFFLVQSETDSLRFAELLADPSKVFVTGNMKFDASLNHHGSLDGRLKDQLGYAPHHLIFLAGSTHPGEEEILLRVFMRLKKDFDQLRLILAPRHVERAKEIAKLARREGVKTRALSDEAVLSEASDELLIVDKIGELRKLYTAADLVFMGGSLIRHGGQNPLEPASSMKPILFGPHTFNFKEIYERIHKEGAGIGILNEEELFQRSKALLTDFELRERMGEKAFEMVKKSGGATERNIEVLKDALCITV